MATLAEMFGAGAAETFFGLPRCDDLAGLTDRIALIAAGMATPYASVGPYCAGGPAAIRAATAAYGRNLAHVNFDLGGPVLPRGTGAVDAGALPQRPDDPAGNRDRIRTAVAQVLDRGGVPVLVGGDDSVQIPMLEAYAGRRRDLTIVQIDAHIDWRDAVEGERLGLSSTMRRASEMAHVGPMVQVGQRGIGSAQLADMQDALERGVTFLSGREVAREGTGRALERIVPGAEVVICLDLDALDPAIMPAVIGRTAGGMGYWQVLELIAGIAGKARIAGFGMVEFMPEQDIGGMGALTAAQLLASVIGIMARQG